MMRRRVRYLRRRVAAVGFAGDDADPNEGDVIVRP